jgi:hypothetical protein
MIFAFILITSSEAFCGLLLELFVKPSCLHSVFGPAFTPYPLFQLYLQSNEIFLNFDMKCWNSAFNAQGSKVIIVIVQVGALKIICT